MGKKQWSIVDGYRPPKNKGDAKDYQGHECVLILNRNTQDAHCVIDIYFEDRPPFKGIKFTAPAERISTFYTDNAELFGKAGLDIMTQYSMYIDFLAFLRPFLRQRIEQPVFSWGYLEITIR